MAVGNFTRSPCEGQLLFRCFPVDLRVRMQPEGFRRLTGKQRAALQQMVNFRSVAALIDRVLHRQHRHTALMIGKRRKAVANQLFAHQRPHAVVDDHTVVLRYGILHADGKAIMNGFLPRIPGIRKGEKFRNPVFFHPSADLLSPGICRHDDDFLNGTAFLKLLQRIQQNRFLFHFQILLRKIPHLHSRSDSPR